MADKQRRSRRARGVALVEFTLVALLLFTLIFGIIGYAYMMSFQQSLTQAAAEGARAGAVAPSDATDAEIEALARAAIEQALGGFDDTGDDPFSCASPGMDCDIQVITCGDNDCIEVALSYAYRSNTLLPSLPGLNVTLPQSIDYTATAEVSE